MIDLRRFPNHCQSKHINHSDLVINDEIGSGSFSAVYNGYFSIKNQEVAIKKIFFPESDCEKSEERFIKEVSILSKHSHRFLLDFVGFTNSEPFYIVTEYMPNGSLYNCLHIGANRIDFNDTQKSLILYGIAVGMEYLHKNDTIHRDLKTQNVLIDKDFLPVIADFGSSKEQICLQIQTNQSGTPQYMAPEFLDSGLCNEKIDVYSYGMVFWEILMGKVPFDSDHVGQILRKVFSNERPPIPDSVPTNIKLFIERCWSHNPDDRPSFSKVVEYLKNGLIIFPNTDITEFNKKVAKLSAKMRDFPVNSHEKKLHRGKLTNFSDFNKGSIGSSKYIRSNVKVPSSVIGKTIESHLKILKQNPDEAQIVNAIQFLEQNEGYLTNSMFDVWDSILIASESCPKEVEESFSRFLERICHNKQLFSLLHNVRDISTKINRVSFIVFKYLATETIDFVSNEFIQKVEHLLNTTDKAILILFNILDRCLSEGNEKYKTDILTVLHKYAEKYSTNKYGERILYWMVRCEEITSTDIVKSYMKSSVPRNCAAGYMYVSKLQMEHKIIKMRVICEHMNSDVEDLRLHSLTFIKTYGVNESDLSYVINALLDCYGNFGQDEALLLLCFLAKNESNSKYFVEEQVINNWMPISKSRPSILKLFLVLQEHTGPKQTLTAHHKTPSFLLNILDKGGDCHICSCLWAMSKLEYRKNVVESFRDAGVVQKVCSILLSTENPLTIGISASLFSKFCLVDIPIFCDLVSRLLDIVDNSEMPDISCIQMLSFISAVPSTHRTFINKNFIKILDGVKIDEAMPYVQKCFSNLRESARTL